MSVKDIIFGATKYSPTTWFSKIEYGTSIQEDILSVSVDFSDNIYVLIKNITNTTFGIVKFDSNCEKQWEIAVTGTIFSLDTDNLGNIYTIGSTALTKYDSNGTCLWVNTYSISVLANATISVTGDGTIYVLGAISTKYALIKYNTNGTRLWGVTPSVPITLVTDFLKIAISSAGNIYVATIKTLYRYTSEGVLSVSYDMGSNVNILDMTVTTAGTVYMQTYNTVQGQYILVSLNPTVFSSINWRFYGVGATGGSDVIADSSNNLYHLYRQSTTTLSVCKRNSAGTVVWNNTFAIGTGLLIKAMTIKDNYIYVIGTAGSTTTTYGFIIRLKLSGEIAKSYTIPFSLTIGYNTTNFGTTDTTYFSTPTAVATAPTLADPASSSYSGTRITSTSTGTDAYTYGLEEDSSNNLYLIGKVNYASGFSDIGYIAKIDSAGNHLFSRRLSNKVWGIVPTSSGFYAVGGNGTYIAVSSNMFIASYNSAGTMLWLRTISSTGTSVNFNSNDTTNIALDTSGNIYVAGNVTVSPTSGNYSYLIKYDSNGTLQFAKQFPTKNITNILIVSDSVYLIGGDTLFLFTTAGALTKAISIKNSGTSIDAINAITTDGTYLYISGKFNTTGGSAILKLSLSGSEVWSLSVPSYFPACSSFKCVNGFLYAAWHYNTGAQYNDYICKIGVDKTLSWNYIKSAVPANTVPANLFGSIDNYILYCPNQQNSLIPLSKIKESEFLVSPYVVNNFINISSTFTVIYTDVTAATTVVTSTSLSSANSTVDSSAPTNYTCAATGTLLAGISLKDSLGTGTSTISTQVTNSTVRF